MSLNWDLSKCKDVDKIKGDGLPWVITECLIWYTMAVDLGSITEDNIDEFCTRMYITDNASTPMMYDGKEHRSITYAEVKDRIGLSTNVCHRTKAQFSKRIASMLRDGAESKLRKMKRED